ncbi:MAG: hypothetical protein ACRDZX_07485 [Acidimicrobiales bacterium]
MGRDANERYLEALAWASDNGEGVRALDGLCRPAARDGRHHASFKALGRPDLALSRAALAGEHAIVGFRNSDLTSRLHPVHRARRTKPAGAPPGPRASSPS